MATDRVMSQRWATGRVEAFSDGVFAIAIALSFLPFPTGLMAEALRESRDAERAAVVVYGATALVIELLIAASWRYAGSRPGVLSDPESSVPRSVDRRRGTMSVVLYAAAIAVGVLLFPRLAAFGYLAVAAVAVLSARGEGRLTLRGPGN
jgi:uncharacterized membrane protein